LIIIKGSLNQVKSFFPITGHYELTYSQKAEEYVWKDDTSLGERFEMGKKPFKRNSETDWDEIKKSAQSSELDSIPSDIYIRYYNNLRRISADHLRPIAIDRKCTVLWGSTGTGKSHRAWTEFPNAYSKDPRTKWWVGYRGEAHIIIDEFRGGIDIAHLLRWIDKYPVQVETKGGASALQATHFILTSNLHPFDWYPDVDKETLAALERRLNIIKVEDKLTEINLFP